MSPTQPRVFISRTSTGLTALAEEIKNILIQRGATPVIQTEFLPDWRNVPQMLQDQLHSCDCVIALIGPVHGGEPKEPPAQLPDSRTHDSAFSFTQWEYLVARALKRPTFTFLVQGAEMITPHESESPELASRQQAFITHFAKDRSSLYYTYTDRKKLLDHIREMELPLNVSTGRRHNLPPPIGGLFVGREKFMADLREKLLAGGTTVIRGKQAIHGMGGVGKTRAAIEYGWTHATDYNALLFLTADSPESLRSNLAALCGPLVLNLPEQTAKELEVQIAAVHRWLAQNPGWFLVIDNVDSEQARAAVRELTAQIPHGHILITSRLAEWPAGFTSLELDVLDEASSIRLLLEHTEGRRIPQEKDASTAAAIARELGGLSLALEQAAAWVRKDRHTLADYLHTWQEMSVHLHTDPLTNWAGDYPRSLLVTYRTSLAQLSAEARSLYALLAWCAPDPIPMLAIAHLSTLRTPRTHAVALADLHLARLSPDGSELSIHRMLQAIEQAQQPEPQPPALLAALEWLNQEMPFDTDDVRTWPIAVPLAPHGISAAQAGAARAIPEPSGRLLNGYATLLMTRADHAGSEPLYQQALALFEASLGENHPNVASALNNLAALLKDTNRLAEAEPLMRRALAIDAASLGRDHPTVAIDLGNLAQLLKATNRLAEAEPLMRRALAIDEASFGQEHSAVAHDLSSLAGLLQDTNRHAEAEPLIRRALAIDEASFGQEHPKVAIRLNNLAQLLQTTSRLAEAEPLMRRALAIDEASFGQEHPDVARDLNNLAGLLQNTNRLAEAEPLMRRALAIDEASFGQDHPNVARDLNNLAQLLKATNRLAEAEPLMRRALAIDEASFGQDHPNVARDLNNLAQLLQDTNRLAEAELLMRRIVQILIQFTRTTGHHHPHLMLVLTNYFGLLLKMGDTEAHAVEKIGALVESYGMSLQSLIS